LNTLNLRRYLKRYITPKRAKKELKKGSFSSIALSNKKGMGYQRTYVK